MYKGRSYNDEKLATNASEILSLKAMGMDDFLSFYFMDPPQMETLIMAMKGLHALSALKHEDKGLLKKLDKRMSEFPLESSKILIMSVHLEATDESLTIVSILFVQNIY